MIGRLSALQSRVLEVLAPIVPRWTLTGGGALAGFHLRHRTTRDLDLFWHGERVLVEQARDAERLLAAAGIMVTVLRRSPAFVQMQAKAGADSVVIDLVAEPVAVAESPVEVRIGAVGVLVDTPQEILANKIGTLLHRAEPRDLIDLRALLHAGSDLQRALRDAARKDVVASHP
jgi:hypothetical protein